MWDTEKQSKGRDKVKRKQTGGRSEDAKEGEWIEKMVEFNGL